MSNPSPFTPRLQRVIPIHIDPNTSSVDPIVDLIFVDLPTNATGTFTMSEPDSNNVITLTYSEELPEITPAGTPTTSLLFYHVSPFDAPTYSVCAVGNNPNGPIKQGTPIPPKQVPRDDEKSRVSRGMSSAQAYECHAIVVQSVTNIDQFYSGGIIHFPTGCGEPSYQSSNTTELSLGYVQDPGITDQLAYIFESDTILAQNLGSMNLPGTKFSKMYIIGEESLGAEFLSDGDPTANPPIPAFNLYTDTNEAMRIIF